MSNILNSLKSRVHKELKTANVITAPLAMELVRYAEKLEGKIEQPKPTPNLDKQEDWDG